MDMPIYYKVVLQRSKLENPHGQAMANCFCFFTRGCCAGSSHEVFPEFCW